MRTLRRPSPPRLDTVATAKRLGLSEKQVRAACVKGQFASARKGEGRSARWTIDAQEVEALAGNAAGPAVDEATLRQIVREELLDLFHQMAFVPVVGLNERKRKEGAA